MKKRSEIHEETFINRAIEGGTGAEPEEEDRHRYVHRMSWPIATEVIEPSLADGSHLHKSMTLLLQEKEWNSIDRHTKALGVSKSAWVRYAMLKLLQEEQDFCFEHRMTEAMDK
jgi:hypothetical protein